MRLIGKLAKFASLIILCGCCWSHPSVVIQRRTSVLEWDYDQKIPNVTIIMDSPEDPNMGKLRTDYKLGTLVSEAKDEYETLRRIVKWTHNLWKHSGNHEPTRPDPLTILKEASEGKRFRCVEYAVVVAASARALGLPSRVLGLKRKDAETAQSGAGHVVAEVWLRQFNKWVFADAQFDALPELDGVPLNAVEFQSAIAHDNRNLLIRSSSLSEADAKRYVKWVSPYLYYFDFRIDQRFFLEGPQKEQGTIMLVPKGAKELKVFQRKFPIKNCTYVSNPATLYPSFSDGR